MSSHLIPPDHRSADIFCSPVPVLVIRHNTIVSEYKNVDRGQSINNLFCDTLATTVYTLVQCLKKIITGH